VACAATEAPEPSSDNSSGNSSGGDGGTAAVGGNDQSGGAGNGDGGDSVGGNEGDGGDGGSMSGLCAENEHVQSNACVPCPSGETNEAGDDPAGGDTECNDPCFPALGIPCSEFDQAYVKPSVTGADYCFAGEYGHPVGLGGDTVAIGAPYEDGGGAVYVFIRTGTTWTQQARLTASNADPDDYFGWAVALDTDTLVVGAPQESSKATGVNGDESDNSVLGTGAAYVFVRSGANWTQQAYLKASNTEQTMLPSLGLPDRFGASVAIDGETIAIGAPFEASNATDIDGTQDNNSAYNSGAVYVFLRTGTDWDQQAYIKASNTDIDDRFAMAIALSEDTLAVGAPREDSSASTVNGDQADDNANASGAGYVFTRVGATWSQEAYIKSDNSGSGDFFGRSIALHGDTLALGAPFEDSTATGINNDGMDNVAGDSGAAYVFVRSGTTWTQEAYVKASNTQQDDYFGQGIAIHGDTLAVGAPLEDSNALSVDGAQFNEDAANSGAAYLFVRSAATWSQQAYIKASNTETGDYFGYELGLDNKTLVIAAPYEDSNATGINGNQSDNSSPKSGAAYVRLIAP